MKPVGVLQKGIGTRWDNLIWASAWADPDFAALIKGVIAHESEWSPTAENPNDPSVGLMQIVYGSVKSPYPTMTRLQLLVPETSITLGSRYLHDLVTRLGLQEGVSAYNQGEGNLRKYGVQGNWPYVQDVIENQGWYLDNDPLVATLAPEAVSSDVPVDASSDTTDTPTDWPLISEISGGALLGLAAIIAIILLKRRR